MVSGNLPGYSNPTKSDGSSINWRDVKRRTGGSAGRARNRRLAEEAARKKAQLQAEAKIRAAKADAERKAAQASAAKKLNNVKLTELMKARREAESLRNEMIVARRNNNRSIESNAAVRLRENLKLQAELRGRAFTQSEARRFLGGGSGVQALRAGSRAERDYFKKTGVSLSQEREKLRKQAQLMKGVSVSKIIAEVLPSRTSADRVRIRLPNGKFQEVSKTGRVNISSTIAGEKVVVNNGKIIQVGKDNTQRVMLGNFDAYVRQKQGGASEFTRVAPATSAVNNYRDKLRMKKIRGDINSGEELALLVGGFVGGVLSSVGGVLDLPQAAWSMLRNPSQIKQAYSAFRRSAETFGEVLWLSPGEALANLGGQYYGIKGTSAAIRGVSRVGANTLTRLNPKFTGVANIGSTLKVKIAPGKVVNLKVVGKIPKQTIAKQVAMAGKRVNAVSSVADDLFGLLKKQKVLRKPIPGEARFNPATKSLLKKFDAGTITKTELFKLDTMVQAQGAKGILERSFFADPKGMVRPSRLGIQGNKKLSFSDYMSSEITFKRAKPAIYVFDDLRISKYPNNIKPIVKKMRLNKKLTARELNTYAEWHMKPTGNAKPIGFVTRESEVLLSPGEILKKQGIVGYTLVSGKRVPIVKVSVFKPTGSVRTLITKLKQGKITPTERVRLNRILKQKTGLNYGTSSSPNARARYVSIKKVSYNTLSRFSKTGKKSVRVSGKRTSSKTSRRLSSSRKSTSRSSSPRKTSKTSRKRTSPKSPKKTSRASSPKSPKRTSKGGSSSKPKKPIRKKVVPLRITLPKGFTKKKLSTPQPAYYVIVKRRGKWVKLSAKPLVKKDARDYLAYSVDNGLERSAFFVPLGKTSSAAKLPRNMIGYYSKTSRKLRPYKIRMGKKKQLLDGYIEKNKYIQDTRREKAQLSRSSSKGRQRKVAKKAPMRAKKSKTATLVRKKRVQIQKQRTKRKLTPAQRKILIKRLEKARRAKAQKLKRRR